MEEVVSDEDDVLAHSEDEGEWDDEPVEIEVRPSGSQVISVRIPDSLADLLFEEVHRRGGRMSDVVRTALDHYLRPAVWDVIRIMPGERVRVFAVSDLSDTTNPVVTTAVVPALRTTA